MTPPNDHVGFDGGGPHHCLGLLLASLEVHHLFRVLIDTLPDFDGARSRHGLFIDGMERLPCRFTPTRAGSAYDRVFTLPVIAPVALRTT